MLISHKHKFISIDIPKTGSRSLRESLYPLNIIDILGTPNPNDDFYQHGTALDCRNAFQKNNINFNDYYSFCIVRNPWDRYFSFFKYFKYKSERFKDPKLMGSYLNSKSHVWANSNLYKNWIIQEIDDGKRWSDFFDSHKNDRDAFKTIIIHERPQHEYFLDTKNQISVSYVAQLENLDADFLQLCRTIGIADVKLEHTNKMQSSIQSCDLYNQELINLVRLKEKGVITLKNYRYN
jgi:hypothetical protein